MCVFDWLDHWYPTRKGIGNWKPLSVGLPGLNGLCDSTVDTSNSHYKTVELKEKLYVFAFLYLYFVFLQSYHFYPLLILVLIVDTDTVNSVTTHSIMDIMVTLW